MKSVLTSFLCVIAASAMAQTPNSIRVNQVGYGTLDSKTAAVEESGWAKHYTLREEATGKRVWKGKAVRTAASPWSGRQRAIIDFSTVTKPGTYLLSNGSGSQRIVIADTPYTDLAIGAIKAFYLQRSGEPIMAKYAGEYARPAGHPDDKVMVHPSAASPSRPAGTVISSPGGWYDAGDYNKYIVNSAFSVGIMLDSYLMCPDYYSRLQVNIPESENATPDLLDEIAVNLRWMLTMQDPSDGGVYHKLTTPSFEGFVKPTDCKQQRYVVMKSTAASLDFAATMAKAYRIYSQFPSYRKWAEGALEQARKAYGWAEQNPNVIYGQDEMNRHFDPDVSTGTYGDGHIADERLWAKIELFLATKDVSYVADLAFVSQDIRFSNPSWANVTGLAFYTMVGALHALDGQSIPYLDQVKRYLSDQIVEAADSYVATLGSSCFDSPCGNSPRDFGWGCNGEQVCGKGIVLLYAYELTRDARYLQAAKKTADYLLGRNATGYCFVTGFGTYSPKHPHHGLAETDGIDEPLPGFLVGGPNPGQQDKVEYPSNQPDESYVDHMQSYASNEIAINWNAALVAFIGWLDHYYQPA